MRVKVLKAIRNNTPGVKAYVEAIKAGKSRNQHVTPVKDSNWQVKAAGAERATKKFKTQGEAIEYARKIAINQQTELFIHGRNGKIRERNSFGIDSFPPRG